MTYRIIWTHPQHMEDILRVDLGRGGILLMRKHSLQIFLEVVTLKMIRNILVTMSGMCLVRRQEVLMVAWIDGARQSMF